MAIGGVAEEVPQRVRRLIINPGTENGWFFGYSVTAAIFDTLTERELDFIHLWYLLVLNLRNRQKVSETPLDTLIVEVWFEA